MAERARAPKPKSASRFLRERRDGVKPERVNAPGQGRPQTYFPTPEDREQVERLAGLLAPYDEIAAFMKISKDTLLRHYQEDLTRGQVMGKLGGRRMMMHLVRGAPAEYDKEGNVIREEVKPDPAMVRFFARTKLGYIEEYKLKTAQTVEPVNFDWSTLNDDELAAAERIFAKALAASTGDAPLGPSGDKTASATTRH
jgi:hypothetical protein